MASGSHARLARLRSSSQWQFFGALVKADRGLAIAWLSLIVVRGLLPVAMVLAIGSVVRSIVTPGNTTELTRALVVVSVVFTLTQILGAIHAQVGVNLGDRLSTSLQDQLLEATLGPDGIRHMESSDLADRLAVEGELRRWEIRSR